MKKITMSIDGLPRFSLNIEHRISAYDMAIFLMIQFRREEGMSITPRDHETLADRDERIENRIKDLMSGSSDAKLLSIVEDTIQTYGTESPHYTVSDEGYGTATDFLTGYLIRKYKGFQKLS